MDARTGKVVERGRPAVIDNSGNRIDQTPDDKILPPRCSSVEEILERPDRKLAMLNAEVTRIQTRVRVLKIGLASGCQKELQRLQEREREIADELLGHIGELEGSLSGLDGALKRRGKDLERTAREYEAKSQRFQVLKAADELL